MGISAESFTKLFEQAQLEAQAGAAPPTIPPTNAGAQPQQPPTQQPAQQQQPTQEVPQNKQSGDVVTLDKIVDHLNGIRSGKSFTDPLVYTSLSNIFNSLSAAEKAVLDKVLSQLDASITQITKQQSPPNPNNQEAKGPAIQPSMGVNQQQSPNSFQGPQAAQQAMSQTPMAGMMSGVLAESSSLASLVESLNKPTGALLVDGKEVMFGSDEHLNQVRVVVDGLESLKNCYKKGSSIRYTLSAACGRLRKILKDSELKAQRSALNAQPLASGE
jgi:hypothetical protein